MKIGITGTRNGLAKLQQAAFEELILFLRPTHLSHGSCGGVDVQAARIVRSLFGSDVVIECRPSVDKTHQESSGVDDIVHEPKTNFARNRDIVDWLDANGEDCLIACPKEMYHQTFGGTWMTFDYCTKKHKRRFIVYPDGKVEEFKD